MTRLRFSLPFLLIPLLATACQTPATVTGKAECALFPPITYSAKGDTPATVAQIRSYNAGRDKYCGR